MKTETAPTAREIMRASVRTIEPDMQLGDVVAFLLKHKLSNAPVVRREGNRNLLLGFVSEADCLEYLANEVFYGNPSPRQTAETIMTRHPACVGPDADVFLLTSVFISHRYRHLPVVEDGYLLGIISRRDMLKGIDRYYREDIRFHDQQRHPVDLHQIINHRFLVTR
jgi:CBS domain-containing protein